MTTATRVAPLSSLSTTSGQKLAWRGTPRTEPLLSHCASAQETQHAFTPGRNQLR